MTPGISVIIPLHDQATVVGEAIGSALAQSHAPLEVIVVDDGSCDGGASVAERFGDPVRVLRQARGGAGRARNHGAREARGELLAFLDADDRMAPDRLRRQVAALEQSQELDGVYGDVAEFRDGAGGGPGPARPARLAGCLLLRRGAFERVGPLAEDLPTGEFLEWLSRAEDAGLALAYEPGLALERRLHAGNHGHATDRSGYAHMLHAVLERRRAAR